MSLFDVLGREQGLTRCTASVREMHEERSAQRISGDKCNRSTIRTAYDGGWTPIIRL